MLSSITVCIFFFSSRRRHTRFDCDWSSDVCSSDHQLRRSPRARRGRPGAAHRDCDPRLGGAGLLRPRSEEHTSELQSQSNLVCRLLLEKKKTVEGTTSCVCPSYSRS